MISSSSIKSRRLIDTTNFFKSLPGFINFCIEVSVKKIYNQYQNERVVQKEILFLTCILSESVTYKLLTE